MTPLNRYALVSVYLAVGLFIGMKFRRYVERRLGGLSEAARRAGSNGGSD